jgi:hypothetical protein
VYVLCDCIYITFKEKQMMAVEVEIMANSAEGWLQGRMVDLSETQYSVAEGNRNKPYIFICF